MQSLLIKEMDAGIIFSFTPALKIIFLMKTAPSLVLPFSKLTKQKHSYRLQAVLD